MVAMTKDQILASIAVAAATLALIILTLTTLTSDEGTPHPSISLSLRKGSRKLQTAVTPALVIDPKTVSPRIRQYKNLATDATALANVKIPCKPALDDPNNKLVTIPEFYGTTCLPPAGSCMRNNANYCETDNINELVFFHVGKGGGGTVEYKLRNAHISFGNCHPRPFQKFINELISEEETLNTILIDVRDPVDRFVSTFKWDLIFTPPDLKSFHLKTFLDGYIGSRKERLEGKYNSDPNTLAAALCSEDKSSEEYRLASETYQQLRHGTKLIDWLGFLLDPSATTSKGIKSLVVLPNEGGHLDELIDSYILHLLQEKYGQDVGSYMHKFYLQPIDTPHKDYIHSTSSLQVPPLTTYGECCMARYLEDDYQLLSIMIGNDVDSGMANSFHPVLREACTSWGTFEQQQMCLEDLGSMIQRRAMYLDRSKGTCAEIFGPAVVSLECQTKLSTILHCTYYFKIFRYLFFISTNLSYLAATEYLYITSPLLRYS